MGPAYSKFSVSVSVREGSDAAVWKHFGHRRRIAAWYNRPFPNTLNRPVFRSRHNSMTTTADRGGRRARPEEPARAFHRRHDVAARHLRQRRRAPEVARDAGADRRDRRALHRAAADDRGRTPGRDRSAGRADAVVRDDRNDQMYEQMREGLGTDALHDRHQRAGHDADHRGDHRRHPVRDLQCRAGR